jgi:AGZA family xanthine/uracil permease-like MFS transporter
MRSNERYRWYSSGDINAYFGLLLDNLAGLVLTVSLLVGAFGMPSDFVVGSMIPGTAIGVLVGDLLYTILAFRLASKTGRNNITAMPLGLDTPSIFGITIFVVGPAFLTAKAGGSSPDEAARFAWHIGICAMIYSGLFKVGCSFIGSSIRQAIPKAGLFGSLTSIALVIISFVPLIDIMQEPFVGLVALAIVLTCLIGQVRLPFRIPGTVAALLVAGILHYISAPILGKPLFGENSLDVGFLPTGWLDVFSFAWWQQMGVAANYLPIVIPFALATVVGGLDCTESASAVGDDYPTFQILGVEAIATLVAGICGGVIQTTPYIGHPAYKAMGGKAAYTLATALTMGFVGIVGGFAYFYMFVPKSAVFPILIFVGLEISAQSFVATPKRHFPALVFACVPALAFLAFFFVDQILGGMGIQLSGALWNEGLQSSMDQVKTAVANDPNGVAAFDKVSGALTLRPDMRENLMIVLMLKNGFVLTSLIWASLLAMAIDRRMQAAAAFAAIAAVCTLFGFIHSPRIDNSLYLPFSILGESSRWTLPAELLSRVWTMAAGYSAVALLFWSWSLFLRTQPDQGPIYDAKESAT